MRYSELFVKVNNAPDRALVYSAANIDPKAMPSIVFGDTINVAFRFVDGLNSYNNEYLSTDYSVRAAIADIGGSALALGTSFTLSSSYGWLGSIDTDTTNLSSSLSSTEDFTTFIFALELTNLSASVSGSTITPLYVPINVYKPVGYTTPLPLPTSSYYTTDQINSLISQSLVTLSTASYAQTASHANPAANWYYNGVTAMYPVNTNVQLGFPHKPTGSIYFVTEDGEDDWTGYFGAKGGYSNFNIAYQSGLASYLNFKYAVTNSMADRARIAVDDNSIDFYHFNEGSNITFNVTSQSVSVTPLRITNNGIVSVGSSNPWSGSKLFVNGAVSASAYYGPLIGTASYAANGPTFSHTISSSYASQSLSASIAVYAPSSSYAYMADNTISASHAISADSAISSSYTLNSGNTVSASHAVNADSAISSSYVVSSSYAPIDPNYSASISDIKQDTLVVGDVYEITSSWSNNSISSSYAPTSVTSSWSVTSTNSDKIKTTLISDVYSAHVVPLISELDLDGYSPVYYDYGLYYVADEISFYSCNFNPISDRIYTLGNSSFYWNNLYVDRINVNGTDDSTVIGNNIADGATLTSGIFAVGQNIARIVYDAGGATLVGKSVASYAKNSIGNSVMVGNLAGHQAHSSSCSTFVGTTSGYNAATSSYSVLLGYGADAASSGLNIEKSIAIGYNAKVSGPNQFVLGATGSDSVNVGINTNNPQYRLHVVGQGYFTGITSSLYGTSSWAISSSYSPSTITSSWSNNSISASYAQSSSFAPVEPVYSASVSIAKQDTLIIGNTYSITSSWANNSISASYAPVEPSYSASVAISKQNTLIVGDVYEITSSWSIKTITASYSVTSAFADNAVSASYAVSSSYAQSASFAILAQNVIGGAIVESASYATYSETAGYASSASYAPVEPAYSASISIVKQNVLITGNTYSITSSWSNNSVSSSYSPIDPAYSASVSIAKQDVLITGNVYNITSSWSNKSISSSYAATAKSSSFATTALNWNSSSLVTLIGTKQNIITSGSSFNITSSRAITASYALVSSAATTASYYGGSVISSSYALTATNWNSSSLVTLIGTKQNIITSGSSLNITSSWAVNAKSASYFGAGTNNYIPKWYNNTLSSLSLIRDDGSDVIIDGDVVPGTDRTYTLGGTSYYWNNLYTNKIHAQTTDAATIIGDTTYNLASAVTPSYAVGIGYRVGENAITSSQSTLIGYYAGQNATNAQYAVLIGSQAGRNATNAYLSVMLGSSAGTNATTANQAVIIGYIAGNVATTASNAVIIGDKAGQNATNAYRGVIIGSIAGQDAKIADYSTMLGYSAGENATTASYATMLGYSAGRNATRVDQSILLGGYAGYSATNAYQAAMIGYSAGQYAYTGSAATLIGYSAGNHASSCVAATCIGYYAGSDATDCDNATIIGYFAGRYAIDCYRATMIGYQAGYNADTSSYATFIGNGADTLAAGLDAQYSTAIGYNAKVSSSYQMALGGTGSDAVNVGINTNNPQYRLHVVGQGYFTGITSSLYGTASWAQNAKSSSYYGGSVISSSYATTAKSASYYGGTVVSSSYALTATNWNSSSVVTLIGTKQNIITSGSLFNITSSWASRAISASYSTYSSTAGAAVSAITADTAAFSDNATSSSHALTANTASYYNGLVESASYSATSSWSAYSLLAENVIGGAIVETASFSIYAKTSSWSENAINWDSSSIIALINTKQDTLVTGATYTITSSWSEYNISSSYSLAAISASYSETASYANNVVNYTTGTDNYLPKWSSGDFTDSVISDTGGQITVGGNILPSSDNLYNVGSEANRWAQLHAAGITGSIKSTDINVNGSHIIFLSNTNLTGPATHSIDVCQSGSYDATFIDYKLSYGSNKRFGTMIIGIAGSTVEYNEVCTVDIGNTSDITLSGKINGTAIAIDVNNVGSNTWTLKAQARYL